MDNIEDLLSKNRKYKNLKSNINTIISKLNSAIENLETPATRIKNIYNIDSISIDENRINSIRQKLIDKRNYLKNNVLYSINKELNELEENIEGMG